MVTIREIRRDRRYSMLVLESGEQYRFRTEDLAGTGLCEGAVLEEQEFHKWIRLLQYPRAINIAVAMLARRPCSKGEIENRLLRAGVIPEITELVIYKLEKEKLLDDEAFCEQWIRYRKEQRYGPVRIRQELRIKGLPSQLIDSVLERTEEPDEEENNALTLARKAWTRIKPGEDLRKSRQKVIVSLVRKGYSWEAARTASDAAEYGIEQ